MLSPIYALLCELVGFWNILLNQIITLVITLNYYGNKKVY